MSHPNALTSLIQSGTKLWLDSVDPDLTELNRSQGVTGATSNPIIIADLIKSGRFQSLLNDLKSKHSNVNDLTWAMTDQLVSKAEAVFIPVFNQTKGDDGYVSFEVDPLLESADCKLSLKEKIATYENLATQWAKDHPNRMIKIPATEAGIAALEPLAAKGIPLNITLIFSKEQLKASQESVLRGMNKGQTHNALKSVYSVFVSRVDTYVDTHYPELSADAKALAGIVNAKWLLQDHQKFWKNHTTKLKQEIIFASTGTKKASDAPWKYVQALAGSDIQTNPPATNEAVRVSGLHFDAQIHQMPSDQILQELQSKIHWKKVCDDLMVDGLQKFAEPQKILLDTMRSQLGL
jgi:transaldolase